MITISAIFWLICDQPSIGWSPPFNPKSLASFSHAPVRKLYLDGGERQLAVSGNTLDHLATRAGLNYIPGLKKSKSIKIHTRKPILTRLAAYPFISSSS